MKIILKNYNHTETDQALYAHMNNKIIKKKERKARLKRVVCVLPTHTREKKKNTETDQNKSLWILVLPSLLCTSLIFKIMKYT
jgi:hypothetical protein